MVVRPLIALSSIHIQMHAGPHVRQSMDFCFASFRVESGNGWFSKHPSANFARVEEDSSVLVFGDARPMRVSENDNVGVVNDASKIIQLMSHQKSNTIAGLPAHWWMTERSDDLHSAGNANRVTAAAASP